MLIKDIVKEFQFELQIKNYSIRTRKGYKNNINRFFRFIEKEYNIVELGEVNKLHVKQYINYLQKQSLSTVYINTILKNLRSFYKYCAGENYCNNIVKDIQMLKEKKVIINTFTDVEVKKMLDVFSYKTYIEARNKAMIAILIDTGIRNLELCSLTLLDVKETVININCGKGNKERVVPISPYLKKILIRYERIRAEYTKNSIECYSNYFLSYRHKPLTVEAVERVVKLCGKEANVRKEIRCSPHTFRHYFAQKQLQNGLDVYSLSRLLGHENIQITKRYLQSIQDKEILSISIKTSPLMSLRGGRK